MMHFKSELCRTRAARRTPAAADQTAEAASLSTRRLYRARPSKMTNPVGFLFAGISVLCFGSNFVVRYEPGRPRVSFCRARFLPAPPLPASQVTKKYKTGDGMFFQWTLASGIFLMGVFMYLFQCSQGGSGPSGAGCPAFQPFSMLGGALWATGNIMTVPIIKTLGLSMGMLTWGMANMVVGWASARFGILGVPQESFSSPGLNTGGVVVAIASMVVFAFIKPTVEKAGATRRGGGGEDAKDSLLGDGDVDQVYAGLYGQGINSDDAAARPAEPEDD